jgi:flagellar assembly factor FliW
MAYSEMTGLEVSEAYVVKASPITGFEAKQVVDLAQAQKAFIAMQETKRNVDRITWRDDNG